jgi:hypothetical protein
MHEVQNTFVGTRMPVLLVVWNIFEWFYGQVDGLLNLIREKGIREPDTFVRPALQVFRWE